MTTATKQGAIGDTMTDAELESELNIYMTAIAEDGRDFNDLAMQAVAARTKARGKAFFVMLALASLSDMDNSGIIRDAGAKLVQRRANLILKFWQLLDRVGPERVFLCFMKDKTLVIQ